MLIIRAVNEIDMVNTSDKPVSFSPKAVFSKAYSRNFEGMSVGRTSAQLEVCKRSENTTSQELTIECPLPGEIKPGEQLTIRKSLFMGAYNANKLDFHEVDVAREATLES